jgi:hypothetical protein
VPHLRRVRGRRAGGRGAGWSGRRGWVVRARVGTGGAGGEAGQGAGWYGWSGRRGSSGRGLVNGRCCGAVVPHQPWDEQHEPLPHVVCCTWSVPKSRPHRSSERIPIQIHTVDSSLW